MLRYCCESDHFLCEIISSLLSWGGVCDVVFVFMRVHIRHYILEELTSFHETGTKIVLVDTCHNCIKFLAIFNVPAWRSYEPLVL